MGRRRHLTAVGEAVDHLDIGDEVFGAVRGAFAEYAVGRAENLVRRPAGLPIEQAAAVATSGTTALQAVRDKGAVQSGETVAVIGAGGGVGCFAVQLAALAGAEVTGVCSIRKTEFVRSLGATRTIDYTTSDVTEGADRFDVIIDCAGNRSLRSLRRVLAPRGRLVIVGGESSRPQLTGVGRVLGAVLLSPFIRQRLVGLLATIGRDDLLTLARHLEAGELVVPVDRSFAFDDAVAAVQYTRDGRACGKVVVRVSGEAGD